MQNNAVRALAGISRFEHITHSFRQFDILKIHDLWEIEIAIQKFKNFKLSDIFKITLLLLVMFIITPLERSN